MPLRTLLVRSVFAVLIVTSIAIDARPLLEKARQVSQMRSLSYEGRRRALFGDFYDSLLDAQRGLSQAEPVGIVMRQYRDVDRAVYANYYLYPRPTRFYFGLIELHDDCRAGKPRVLFAIDLQRDAKVHRRTAEEISLAHYRGAYSATLVPASTSRRDFIVPFAAAAHGEWPAVYVTQASLISDEPATVTLSLQPANKEATLMLTPRKALILDDVLYDTFGTTGIGWLRVHATAPIRAAFALVNVAQRTSVDIPVVGDLPPLRARLNAGEKLWLLNTRDTTQRVAVDGEAREVSPRSLAPFGVCSPHIEVTTESGVMAFTSTKLTNGGTIFSWPVVAR